MLTLPMALPHSLMRPPRAVRETTKQLQKDYDKTEDDLKALQSVGQIIGEVLRQLDAERFIVKASSGPRYVVGCRTKVDKTKLTSGTRVALDMVRAAGHALRCWQRVAAHQHVAR